MTLVLIRFARTIHINDAINSWSKIPNFKEHIEPDDCHGASGELTCVSRSPDELPGSCRAPWTGQLTKCLFTSLASTSLA